MNRINGDRKAGSGGKRTRQAVAAGKLRRTGLLLTAVCVAAALGVAAGGGGGSAAALGPVTGGNSDGGWAAVRIASVTDDQESVLYADAPEQAVPPLLAPQADVVIDIGHGGIDGGTSQGELLEKQLNLEMARKLAAELRQRGISYALTRTGDYAPSDDNKWLRISSRHFRDLAQRQLIIRELHPRVVVSLHVNWSRSESARGPSLLHAGDAPSDALSKLLIESLGRTSGQTVTPTVKRSFYLLKRANCATVIVETGFISNGKDRKTLTSARGQKRIAASVADAVQAYLRGAPAPG